MYAAGGRLIPFNKSRGNVGYRADGCVVEAPLEADGAQRGKPVGCADAKPIWCPRRLQVCVKARRFQLTQRNRAGSEEPGNPSVVAVVAFEWVFRPDTTRYGASKEEVKPSKVVNAALSTSGEFLRNVQIGVTRASAALR